MIIERVRIAEEACTLLSDILKSPVMTNQMREQAQALQRALDGPTESSGLRGPEFGLDGEEITNGMRGKSAATAVKAACRERGEPSRFADEDGILDLLGDMGHLCDATGVDFEKSILWALRRWKEER